ncbi:MAG TPA: NAD(P)/FAD-dependent oxidoreductase [Sulfolobales archaeon]|nr:NAD(P)/FAD-dependent oxidoreductase [Sulfolobales archaeon]
MRRSVEILIVGGGFAGLLTASRIPGSVVFEENPQVGIPPHCTGLVSERTVSLIGSPARESMIARYRSIVVERLRGGEIVNLVPDQAVVRLDRVLLEKILEIEAINQGSAVYTRTRVLSIGDGSIVANNKHGVHRYTGSLVVIAEGSQQKFSRSLGLVRKPELLVGIQGFTKTHGGLDEDEIYVFVDDEIFRDFFGWLIPLGSRTALVGMATRLRDTHYRRLGLFLRILYKRKFLEESRLARMYGGLVVRGSPLEKHYTGSIVAVGDASNFTKPFSGGGLYPSSIQIGALASKLRKHEPLEALMKYASEIRDYVGSLKRQLAITRIIEKLGVEKTLLMLSKLGILKNTESFNYDHHDKSLYTKLKKLLEARS